jgi:hypothetical protein
MARLTKADAARQLGISRTTLYKLIDQGKVSATPDGMIDQTELVRAAPYVDILKERSRTSMDSIDVDTQPSHSEHYERPQEPVHEQPWTPVHERQWTSMDPLVDILREQIQVLRDELQGSRQAAQERERDYREHIAQLTAMLEQAHQQNQRLLDLPRSVPPVRPSPERHPAGAHTAAPRGGSRGDMRRCIVTLLQEHPEGLTRDELQTSLGVDKNLSDTLSGMVRYGLVQRVGRGRYVGVTQEQEG